MISLDIQFKGDVDVETPSKSTLTSLKSGNYGFCVSKGFPKEFYVKSNFVGLTPSGNGISTVYFPVKANIN